MFYSLHEFWLRIQWIYTSCIIWLLSMNCLNWNLSARFFPVTFVFMTISFFNWSLSLLIVRRSNFLSFLLLLFVVLFLWSVMKYVYSMSLWSINRFCFCAVSIFYLYYIIYVVYYAILNFFVTFVSKWIWVNKDERVINSKT